MSKWIVPIFVLFSMSLSAQMKELTPDNYGTWNRIKNVDIATKGNTVIYTTSGEVTNTTLHIYDTATGKTKSISRIAQPTMDHAGERVFYKSIADVDTVKAMRRRKVEKDEQPKDSLAIYTMRSNSIAKVFPIKSYAVPEKYSGYLAYMLIPNGREADSTIVNVLARDENNENGCRLIIRNLNKSTDDTLLFVKDYQFAAERKQLVYHSSGTDSLQSDAGVYLYDLMTGKSQLLQNTQGKISHLSFNDIGDKLSYIVDSDTTDRRRRPYEVLYWSQGDAQATSVARAGDAQFHKDHWISKNRSPYFSEDGKRLFFATAPPPILQDSLILDEEIVDVEVWHYQEQRLYTQQNVRAERKRKQDYLCYYDLAKKRIVPLAHENMPQVRIGDEGNAKYGVGIDNQNHLMYITWLGYAYRDLYKVDIASGKANKIAEKIQGYPNLSSTGDYFVWYDREQKKHFSYDLVKSKQYTLTTEQDGVFYDEENDRPMAPYAYGTAGWTADNQLYLYDRYDIWTVAADKPSSLKKITNGRNSKTVYRIIDWNDELDYIPSDRLMLHWRNESTRQEGYATLEVSSAKINVLLKKDMKVDRYPIKAQEADKMIYTEESFQVFPDLVLADTLCSQSKTISNANPQQKDYSWGSIKLHSWKDDNGVKREGLLVLPAGFDPKKKYPLLVNFYERNSQNLHNHRAPYAHRSTINYTYYASKGYVLFNPDVYYEIGYPGKSSEVAVISGVNSVLDLGFIDKDRVGVQGHSWGGYQVAHLITKTDMFACAESGAPVVNMVSAYGGIRWGPGMSRMFQYEKTQSRLGATLWERPDLYLENSPVFNLHKVNTPVLILHNDEDGAVPWYQGIEYFVGMRRLGKPAWLLNYNGEPHWPVKWQNRLDFNIRMEQFFDHYLMGAPMPRWMKRGVPSIEKGIRQGLELDRP